jgi:hypothetical protein
MNKRKLLICQSKKALQAISKLQVVIEKLDTIVYKESIKIKKIKINMK